MSLVNAQLIAIVALLGFACGLLSGLHRVLVEIRDLLKQQGGREVVRFSRADRN